MQMSCSAFLSTLLLSPFLRSPFPTLLSRTSLQPSPSTPRPPQLSIKEPPPPACLSLHLLIHLPSPKGQRRPGFHPNGTLIWPSRGEASLQVPWVGERGGVRWRATKHGAERVSAPGREVFISTEGDDPPLPSLRTHRPWSHAIWGNKERCRQHTSL